MRRGLADGLAASARIIIGLLFLYAGARKILAPDVFARDVEAYRMLPRAAAVAVALYLPWVEALSGAAAMRRSFAGGGLASIALLLAAFTLAIFGAWARGLDIDCGCFASGAGHANYPWYFTRNAILLSLTLAAWWKMSRFAGKIGENGPVKKYLENNARNS